MSPKSIICSPVNMLAHKAPIHYLKIAEHSNDVAITFCRVIFPSSNFDCRYFPKCCTISYLNVLHSEGMEMISTKLITARGCNFLFLLKGEWCRPHVDNTYLLYLFIHGKIFSTYYNKKFHYNYNVHCFTRLPFGSPTGTYYIVGQFPF